VAFAVKYLWDKRCS